MPLCGVQIRFECSGLQLKIVATVSFVSPSMTPNTRNFAEPCLRDLKASLNCMGLLEVFHLCRLGIATEGCFVWGGRPPGVFVGATHLDVQIGDPVETVVAIPCFFGLSGGAAPDRGRCDPQNQLLGRNRPTKRQQERAFVPRKRGRGRGTSGFVSQMSAKLPSKFFNLLRTILGLNNFAFTIRKGDSQKSDWLLDSSWPHCVFNSVTLSDRFPRARVTTCLPAARHPSPLDLWFRFHRQWQVHPSAQVHPGGPSGARGSLQYCLHSATQNLSPVSGRTGGGRIGNEQGLGKPCGVPGTRGVHAEAVA